MLIRFSFKNFKSFKNENCLDMEATSLKEHEYNIAKTENGDYLKIAAIYGANASGKTNVLQAFSYMKKKVLVSDDSRINNNLSEENIFTFMINNEPISLEVEILAENNKIYKYGFEVLIAFIVNIAIVLSIGLLFNKIFYSIAFLICYCPIRQFAGGYHANNYTKCLLIFILIFILTINTSSNVDSQIYTLMIFIISTLSYTGIFILAPIEHRNNPLTLREIKKYKKISRILAGVVYILNLIFMEIDKLRELSAYTCSSLFWINMMLCLGVLKQLFSKGD